MKEKMTNQELIQLRELLCKLHAQAPELNEKGSFYGLSMDRAMISDTCSIVGAYWQWSEEGEKELFPELARLMPHLGPNELVS